MSEFASSKYTAGQLNAMVKGIRRIAGKDGVEELLKSNLDLVVPDAPPLLRVIDTIELPVVRKFVAKDSFTKANGIAFMGDNFQKMFLPLAESGLSAATLTVSELTEAAKDMRIATNLNVDKNGEVALAHLFELTQRHRKSGDPGPLRTDGGANAVYLVGVDGNTWVVCAYLNSDGWRVYARALGGRDGWDAGVRFLSR